MVESETISGGPGTALRWVGSCSFVTSLAAYSSFSML